MKFPHDPVSIRILVGTLLSVPFVLNCFHRFGPVRVSVFEVRDTILRDLDCGPYCCPLAAGPSSFLTGLSVVSRVGRGCYGFAYKVSSLLFPILR